MSAMDDEAAAEAAYFAAQANGGVPLDAQANTVVEFALADLSRLVVMAAQAALAGRNVTGAGLTTTADGAPLIVILYGSLPDGTSFH